jgi:exopolyphosphatase / guanosine-5'-triphosphate,3'-diphosphate pyrophosphatase
MKIGVIDIGTNTVLLLVAQFDSRGRITPLVYEQRVPRLGKGVDRDKCVAPDAMERVLRVLHDYKAMMSQFELHRIVVCGTSAVRDASNREEFARLIREKTGFDLEILSGEDEALWTYRGAISGVPDIQRATVVDIGGGSTEIIVGDAHDIMNKISLDIGSVRLTERFFKHDPPTHPELEAAIEVVENELAKPKGFDFAGSLLIGVAGTATALAILDRHQENFAIESVTNYRLPLENVSVLFRMLRGMPSSAIQNLSSVMIGRADVMTAGVFILREVMAHYKFSEMIVSERGVRYGLAIREWEKLEPRHQDK